ncbi:hypothetical protein FHS27_005106 [Rhodopirellula rubra]|uniref:Uncharacterized protein n=1 Tax=Aporhodopirellula rubra TaxID=980271 RepID=A0A7W5E306_9BACT|nr:hypothetical protein [Aporhodopirellula rubra]
MANVTVVVIDFVRIPMTLIDMTVDNRAACGCIDYAVVITVARETPIDALRSARFEIEICTVELEARFDCEILR